MKHRVLTPKCSRYETSQVERGKYDIKEEKYIHACEKVIYTSLTFTPSHSNHTIGNNRGFL